MIYIKYKQLKKAFKDGTWSTFYQLLLISSIAFIQEFLRSVVAKKF